MADMKIDVLKNSQLLSSLPDEALEALAQRAAQRNFTSGEVICEVGDPGDTLFIVQEGLVEIRRSADSDVVLDEVRPGEHFGELAVFDPAPRSAAAVATEATVAMEVSRKDLATVLATNLDATMAVMGALARVTTQAKEQVMLVNRFLDKKVRERTEEVRETQLEVIRRLGRAAEFRDDDTGEHIYRMSHYSGLLARAVGFTEEQAEHLLIAAPMHDVGKIGIPDRVLLKPGKLDDEEWEIMRAHTIMGAQMLVGSKSSAIQLAKTIALEHHERWDGRGYPNGRKGEEICLEARICTIADVFDALTSKRPYKDPWTFDDALAEIEKCSGTMFDPELASAFVGLEHQLRDVQQASKDGRVKDLPSMKLEGP